MTLSEEMREYLFRLSEHEPVTRPEAGWPDAVAELEAENDRRADKIELLREYVVHKRECFKNMALADLGVGGPMASCTCGLDDE